MTNLALTFDNRFIRELPGDPIKENYARQVSDACYSSVVPKAVSNPKLLAYSPEVAAQLGLTESECQSDEFLNAFSGKQLTEGMQPYALCYGGHQFGHWAGQLGDGRAINLGESIDRSQQHHTLQLKGAGPTPYSRQADGFAVLRSSVREFLCSEAMFHLGVPTTRALSLVLSGENVMRDMFYDGHPKNEPGAIVCRVAPSFVRFGNFELLSFRGEHALLKQLADYTIGRDFPHLGAPGKTTYLAWFNEICERTADMIVHWMRVGFVHGVMNTDNMSILGLTIDYGPYGWLENYDPNWTPNTTDAGGRRYRFNNQGRIAHWNLLQLANALYPLIGEAEPLEEIINHYGAAYLNKWQRMMASKLGLVTFKPGQDDKLINTLIDLLPQAEADMSLFFRHLADVNLDSGQYHHQDALTMLNSAYYKPSELTPHYQQSLFKWLDQYQQRMLEENHSHIDKRERMNRVNPLYVLRNYLAQLAIDKSEQGDHSLIQETLDVLRHPYTEQEGKGHFAEKRPEWARHRAGCSMLSCSS